MHFASRTFLLSLLLLDGAPALAHPGHSSGGMLAGLQHPVTGLDHLLAMVAVGLIAATRGGRALWVWPVAFVGATTFGFISGRAGLMLQLIEPMILASVVIFGLLIASTKSPSIRMGVLIIAVFGLFHGQAHAVEAGVQDIPAFAVGFIATSIALHMCGIGLGRTLRGSWRPWLGAATAIGGIAMMLA